MRTIVHLSDLHFGKVDAEILEPLIALVTQLAPDLVVVSGDLTQRAKSEQFQQARQFLDALPMPQIVVPGNHDIPLYNLFKRFVKPLKNYKLYVTDDLAPFYLDDEIAVIGINTARSLTIKDGRINEEQIAAIHSQLATAGDQVTKIVVTHHPFDLPDDFTDKDLVGRANAAMAAFAECGADLLLAGHLHVSNAESTADRYKFAGFSALVVQAGTATSTRVRGEMNSFNVIRVEPSAIAVERYHWEPEQRQFTHGKTETFKREANVWSSVSRTMMT